MAQLRPGGLAQIIKVAGSPAELLYLRGAIVTTINVSRLDQGMPMWRIDYTHEGKALDVAEYALRPLDNPDNDQVDEMVRLVGPAPKLDIPEPHAGFAHHILMEHCA